MCRIGLEQGFHSSMNYETTATRKRPLRLDKLAGQEFVTNTLKNAVEKKQLAHAYLFSGPRGVGKTSAARILARSVNCETGMSSNPCGVCSNCREIARGNSLDVLEIDGASNTGVNDVREIKDELLFKPTKSPYKIYIIDEVHMLSISAFNALLKTIEEPPAHVLFIFATTELHKVPATIKSRCQQFHFRAISVDTIKALLKEICTEKNLEAEDEALLWISMESSGSLRDAYTLFDQLIASVSGPLTLEHIRQEMKLVGLERMNLLLEAACEGNENRVLRMIKEITDQGVAVEQICIDTAGYFRNLLFLSYGIEKESVLGHRPERFSRKVRETLEPTQLQHGLDLLFAFYRDMNHSLHAHSELELLFMKLCRLKQYLSPEALLHRLEGFQESLLSSTPEGEAPPDSLGLGGRADKGLKKEELKKKIFLNNPPVSGEKSEASVPDPVRKPETPEQNPRDEKPSIFSPSESGSGERSPAVVISDISESSVSGTGVPEPVGPESVGPAPVVAPPTSPVSSPRAAEAPETTRAPEEAESGLPGMNGSERPLPAHAREFKKILVKDLKRENIPLSDIFEKSTGRLHENELFVRVENAYEKTFLEKNRSLIESRASDIMRRRLLLKTGIETKTEENFEENKDVLLVCNVFRGEVIATTKREVKGESF